MGGKRSGKGGRKKAGRPTSVATTAPRPAPRTVERDWVSTITVGVLTVIAAALIAPFGLLPAGALPLVVGAMAGLWSRRPVEAGVIGGVATAAGCAVVLEVYRLDALVVWTKERMPAYFVQDSTRSVFDFIVAVVSAHPLMTARAEGQGYVLAGVLVVLAAGFAAALAWWLRGSKGEKRASWVAWALVAVIAVSFAYTAWEGSATFRSGIAREPVDGSYAYDGVFNIKTYYRMRGGEGFYDAYVYSMTHDARDEMREGFRDGKFTKGSPVLFRSPAAFYLWRVVGADGADGVMLASILASTAVLVGSYVALRRVVTTRAVFVVAALYPGLILHTVWHNVWFPDWWAALAVLGSALLLVAKRYGGAGALAVLAVVFREVAGLWLLTLIAVAVVRWARGEKEWRARAGAYAGGLAGAIGLFAWHVAAGSRFFTSSEAAPAASLQALVSTASGGVGRRLLAPTSYLMLPYGMFAFPTWLTMPAAAAGFWLALPVGSAERLALAAYPLFMLAYFTILGAHSSYWGQLVMPLSVIGSALLLARADVVIAKAAGWVRRRRAGSAEPVAAAPLR